MPDDVIPATNIYDMRITQHEDGWIYGVFCAERHDDSRPGNLSAATVDDKAGFWKCPYHNSRMCLEIIERKCV